MAEPSDGSSGGGRGFFYAIVFAIVLLSVGSVAVTIYLSERHDVSDGYIPLEEREGTPVTDEGDVGTPTASRPSGHAGSRDVPDLDVDGLADALLDGGAAAAPLFEPSVVRTGPTTPERSLSRAHFWQGLLETQIDLTRQRLERARAEGHDGIAERLERQIERLEEQRDPLEDHIDALEDELEDAPPASADAPSAEDPTGEAPSPESD
ncbi:MAG: hypothetical protein AB7S26_25970 [Sandaracinaceae bacterium]